MPRGCGERVDGGMYLVVPSDENGTPIEEFCLDPARPWTGGAFRAPVIAERHDKVNDILMWVGAEHYPFVPDFIEEARYMGISKRIPSNFPFEQLTPFESKLVLIHPRAIPAFRFTCMPNGLCLKGPKDPHELNGKPAPCLFDDWPLSSLLWVKDKHEAVPHAEMPVTEAEIRIPSHYDYTVKWPILPGRKMVKHKGYEIPSMMCPYNPGAFFAIRPSVIEMVARKVDPEKVERQVKRFAKTAWDFRVVEG